MSVPIGWNTGNDKRDITAKAARYAIEGFFMVTGSQLSMEWQKEGLRFYSSVCLGDTYIVDYEDLEGWIDYAKVSPFCQHLGYVSTMILQQLFAWWEGICNYGHDSDAALDDLINAGGEYEEAELTPGQEEFLENAYQDKVEQGEP